MKSRIKIDYERGLQNHPVIKIITHPNDDTIRKLETPSSNEDIEEDVQDRLVKDLLHSPCKCDPNSFFEVKTTFPLDSGARVTTIGAVQEEDMLYRFRHATLNRYVPYKDIVEMNREFDLTSRSAEPVEEGASKNPYFSTFQRIHQFFNWLDKTERPSWEEQQPGILVNPTIEEGDFINTLTETIKADSIEYEDALSLAIRYGRNSNDSDEVSELFRAMTP